MTQILYEPDDEESPSARKNCVKVYIKKKDNMGWSVYIVYLQAYDQIKYYIYIYISI